MKLKLLLASFGIFLALFSAEIAARIWTYYIEGHGRSVKELLKDSEKNSTVLAENTTNLRGLIRLSDNSDLVYELKPNTSGTFQSMPYQSNSFGIRDREYSVTKPADTLRIVGIGDSVMFGWGVDEQDSYLSLLENKLNADAISPATFEVINFATPGYNTAMEITQYEKRVVQFNPDIIVLHVVNNDLDLPLFMLKPQNVFSLNESFLAHLVNTKVSASKATTLVRYGTTPESDILEEYKHLAGAGAFSKALKKLAILANEKSIPVYVVYGRLPYEIRKILSKFSKNNNFHLVAVKNYTEEILTELKIPNNPKDRALALQINPNDSHPNKIGHIAYARALIASLKNDPLLKNKVDAAAFSESKVKLSK